MVIDNLLSPFACPGGGPGEGPGGGNSGGGGGPVDLRTESRVGSLSGGAGAVDTNLREQQLQQELVLLKQQQELQKQMLFAEFQKKHEVLTRQHEVQLQEHLKVDSQVFSLKERTTAVQYVKVSACQLVYL